MNRNQHLVIGHKADGKTETLAEKLSWAEAKKEVMKPRAGFVKVTGNFINEPPKFVNGDPSAGLPASPAPDLTGKKK